MNISDGDAINLQKAISILNSEGEKLTPYILTIKNICDNEVDYQVNLETLDIANKLADQYITLKVNNDENKVLDEYTPTDGIIEGRKSAYALYEGHLKKNQVMSFEIRMWMGEEVKATEEVMNKLFQSKVTVEATVNNKDEEYKEDILNGADPVLKEGLIPVTINDKGEVYRANLKEAWYNYADKKWANAIILVDGAKEPKNSEKIPEENIESYFVWIPKYKYKIFDMGKYTEAQLEQVQDKGPTTAVKIQFGLTNTTDDETKKECKTPNESGVDGNCHVNDWMTHPAFTAFEGSKGFWVGKFETGYNQDTTNSNTINVTESWTTEGAEQNVESSSKVIIKPNVYSWRYISLGNAFKTSYEYQRENLDSHLMKNTEWGAVAYLTQSIYGRCSNSETTTCTEVAVNINSNYMTGYSNVPYTDKESVASSTTNNYTGIYDMSGSAWEYVMGAVSSASNAKDINKSNIQFQSSGLTSEDLADLKYIDLYINGEISQFNRRILGDATGEMGPFRQTSINHYISPYFNDWAVFFSNSFLGRGSTNDGINSGIFAFYAAGPESTRFSYRIVLTPQ